MPLSELPIQISGRQRLLRQAGLEKIAVFRALHLGDMLCAVPALRAIRTSLPNAHITLIGLPWAIQFAQRFARFIDDFAAFPGHPSFPEQAVRMDEIASFYDAMRSRGFDLAVQMHGSGTTCNQVIREFGARITAGFAPADASALDYFLPYPASGPEPLRLLRLAQFLGAEHAGDELEFPLCDDDEREMKGTCVAASLEPESYICIHPGADTLQKCWPPECFAEIGDRLHHEFNLQVVLTGSANEANLAAAVARHMKVKAINATVPLSIGATASLISGARLLVCNDTGMSHIAAALKVSSVVIFRTAGMQRWAPLNQRLHRCVWDPYGMKAISVLQEARALLKSNCKS